MGLLCLVLVVLALNISHGSAQRTINLAVGGKLVLELEPKPPTIDRVVWKHGVNLLADLTFGEISYYGSFVGHTELENSGRLTVSDIKLEEGGEYSVEVNEETQKTRYKIMVYELLTPPSIRITPLACGTKVDEKCTLVCELKTNPSTAVMYEWELDDEGPSISGQTLTINHTVKATTFKCWAKNPVSDQASKSVKNPFLPKDKDKDLELGLGLGIPAAVVIVAAIAFFVYRNKTKCMTSDLNTEQPAENVALNQPPEVNSQNGGNRMEDDKNTDQPQDSKDTVAP